MKQIQARLKKLEQNQPQKDSGKRIREIVQALTLNEARFCLWVLCWEDGEIDNPTDHPKPTKEDEKRAAMLLKLPSLKIIGNPEVRPLHGRSKKGRRDNNALEI